MPLKPLTVTEIVTCLLKSIGNGIASIDFGHVPIIVDYIMPMDTYEIERVQDTIKATHACPPLPVAEIVAPSIKHYGRDLYYCTTDRGEHQLWLVNNDDETGNFATLHASKKFA